MTERLYYQNSFLFDFTAAVAGIRELPDGRHALLLDRTAFYPTSGGQTFDTGWVEFVSAESGEPAPLAKLAVSEVLEDESDGAILHVVEHLDAPFPLPSACAASSTWTAAQSHPARHSGQHVLSAAFLKMFDAPTVSFRPGR